MVYFQRTPRMQDHNVCGDNRYFAPNSSCYLRTRISVNRRSVPMSPGSHEFDSKVPASLRSPQRWEPLYVCFTLYQGLRSRTTTSCLKTLLLQAFVGVISTANSTEALLFECSSKYRSPRTLRAMLLVVLAPAN